MTMTTTYDFIIEFNAPIAFNVMTVGTHKDGSIEIYDEHVEYDIEKFARQLRTLRRDASYKYERITSEPCGYIERFTKTTSA